MALSTEEKTRIIESLNCTVVLSTGSTIYSGIFDIRREEVLFKLLTARSYRQLIFPSLELDLNSGLFYEKE